MSPFFPSDASVLLICLLKRNACIYFFILPNMKGRAPATSFQKKSTSIKALILLLIYELLILSNVFYSTPAVAHNLDPYFFLRNVGPICHWCKFLFILFSPSIYHSYISVQSLPWCFLAVTFLLLLIGAVEVEAWTENVRIGTVAMDAVGVDGRHQDRHNNVGFGHKGADLRWRRPREIHVAREGKARAEMTYEGEGRQGG